jgi:tRNA(adenine34) deaminase
MATQASARDERFMRAALERAEVAAQHGDVPVGAVVVVGEDVVGVGENRRVRDRDPLAHAEVVALRDAADRLGRWRLDDATLYVTLEPCPMCAGALVHARLGRVVWGADDAKGGGCRSLYQICDDPRAQHRLEVLGGVLQHDAVTLLKRFFEARR